MKSLKGKQRVSDIEMKVVPVEGLQVGWCSQSNSQKYDFSQGALNIFVGSKSAVMNSRKEECR